MAPLPSRRWATLLVIAVAGCFSEIGSGGGGDTDGGESAGSESTGSESTGSDVQDPSATSTTGGPPPLPASTDTSSGDIETCGDGQLDDDEACDGGPGCVECSLEHYPCNPVNQVGCAADVQTCDRTRGATLDDQRTGCFQKGLAGWGDGCAYNPLDPLLQCADGLSCIGAAYHPSCSAAECCTQFCDLTDPTTCPDPTTTCLTWKEPGMPPGLDTLGLCIRL